MLSENIKKILASLNIPPDDPSFLQAVFSLAAELRRQSAADPIEAICSEEYDHLSQRLDRSKIQDSCAVRNVLISRNLARLLINDKGEIQTQLLPGVIQKLKKNLYSFGPDRIDDIRRQEHLLQVLTILQQNKETSRLIRNINKPQSHKQVEDIIRHTLQLPPNTVITDAHARQAALAAWLCYLRQNVGSCFATAPAIIVHDEQPALFLKDLNELLTTGRLKRTFGGVEYSVPLSKSWGAGDLKKNFIMQGGDEFDNFEIWLSPGLLAAFEAAGILQAEAPLNHKIESLKAILEKLYKGSPSPFITNAEEILKHVLMGSMGLSPEDLEEYGNRPKAMLQGNLMMQPAASIVEGSKPFLSHQFFLQLEQAEIAFKVLADNALLKSWEFSLASFAETKAQFTRWNLYSSLGMGPQEKGGIGFRMYEIIQRKLEIANRRVQEIQLEYEQLYAHIKYLEARIQRASTEKEIQWMKAEYQSNINEFHTLEEIRNREHNKAHRIAGVFDVLTDLYYDLFPRYFQEVYDADMHEIVAGPYDDSPAGFRLLYKHGRTNTSSWTYIQNRHDFINALSSFFVATEIEIASKPELKGLQQEFSEIVTAIVTHIKTDEFLETAFYRMAAVHNTPITKNPLEHLDKIEKKPWAYTSGGTMGSLVSCYFKLEQQPTETSRWVENPMELLVFLIDTIKQVPHKMMDDFEKENRRSMLIHSPTHAFLLKPFYELFSEAWKSEAFTYTWARDQIIKPIEWAVELISLDQDMRDYLISLLLPLVPDDFKYYFNHSFSHVYAQMSPAEFRRHLVETMKQERGLQIRGRPVVSADDIDSLLFKVLPLFPIHQLHEKIEAVFSDIPEIDASMRSKIMEIWDSLPAYAGEGQFGHAKMLQDICKAMWCLASEHTSSSKNIHAIIVKAARAHGLALPPPISVADSNWMKDDFGFVFSPGTGKIEFWKLDPLGTTGEPMSIWEQWLNGSRKERTWGVYTRPYEYKQ